MIFKKLTEQSPLWMDVMSYVKQCSWRAGKSLSRKMKEHDFQDWERVIVAYFNDEIAGYCTVVKNDGVVGKDYTPYIGYIFVDEKYRGHRVSQSLIEYAMNYLKELGFHEVYLLSDHIGFYEKYGFQIIDQYHHENILMKKIEEV